MSGSLALSAPLTGAEVVAVRRYCGYGPIPAPFSDPVNTILPMLTQDYIDVVRINFLVPLALLEADIPATRAQLNIDTAAVFTRNAREVEERSDLYRDTRLRLCNTLGIVSGPYLSNYIPAGFVV